MSYVIRDNDTGDYLVSHSDDFGDGNWEDSIEWEYVSMRDLDSGLDIIEDDDVLVFDTKDEGKAMIEKLEKEFYEYMEKYTSMDMRNLKPNFVLVSVGKRVYYVVGGEV